MNYSTKRINVFIVLVSSLLMLLVYNLPFKANQYGDMNFHIESKNLALFIKGQIGFDKVVITKAPGPILFYTPIYLLAPVNAPDPILWLYAVVFLSIFSVISLLLIFRIAASFFSKEVGFLAVLLFIIFPIHCYYSLGILAEIPAFFSLSLALYGWSIVYKKPNSNRGWLMLNFGLWFLIMNRPNAMLLLGLLFVVVLYSYFKSKHFFNNYGKKLAITFVIVTFLSIAGLQFAKLSTINKSGENQESLFYFVALQGRFQFREEPLDFRFWDNTIRSNSKDYQNWERTRGILASEIFKSNHSFNEVYSQFLVDDIVANPFWTTRQFFVKCLYGNLNIISKVAPSQFSLGPFKGSLGYWCFLFIINTINIIVLIGIGLFLFHEKKLINYWIFWGIAVSLLVFHGLTYMEPRYIFPSKVALYIMSAAGLYRIHYIKQIMGKLSVYMFPTHKFLK